MVERPGKGKLTIFGQLSDDVGHFRGAGRLGVQQSGEQRKNAHLLDLHAGLGVWRITEKTQR